jgi:hypothetical protein
MIIPIIIIKQVLAAILIITALVLLWKSKYFRPVRLKVKELRIRFHGRPAALKRAKRKAMRLNKKKGKRYRVYFLAMRYRVLHRDDVRSAKRSGFFNHNVNVTNTESLVFFDTNNPD